MSLDYCPFLTFCRSCCRGGGGGSGARGGARGRGRGRGQARGAAGAPRADKSLLDNELDAYMAAANIDDELLM